ncbi:MAG: serine/threonine protein phosphatase [Verrucomicrobiales bacterium]
MTRKDTEYSHVRVGFDGRVHKTFRGLNAGMRFETEVAVLKHLEELGCDYVPRLLEVDPGTLTIVTSNCGRKVDSISDRKVKELFATLEKDFRVRHEDPFPRNITYRQQDGRFCLIDFEFASIVDENGEVPPGGVSLKVPGKSGET